jgi:hypothetical protein
MTKTVYLLPDPAPTLKPSNHRLPRTLTLNAMNKQLFSENKQLVRLVHCFRGGIGVEERWERDGCLRKIDYEGHGLTL